MSASAQALIARALQALEHVDGKTKAERRAVESARELLTSAERELTGEKLPPLDVPAGAREGISVEPRANWRRR